MKKYITKNRSYEIENINNQEVIRSKLYSSKGLPYKILGSYDPESTCFRNDNSKGLATINNTVCSIDELADHLDKEIKIGNKIVARQIKEDGSLADLNYWSTIITSPVQKIIDI